MPSAAVGRFDPDTVSFFAPVFGFCFSGLGSVVSGRDGERVDPLFRDIELVL